MQLYENKSNSAMESGDHSKNGASLKSRMSKGKFKLFALFAFITLFGFSAMAQDIIVLKNGDEIKSIVLEIGTEYIKYKSFNNQTGPTYNVAIAKIFMIKYANGSKDIFAEDKTASKTEAAIPDKTSTTNTNQITKANSSLSAIKGTILVMNSKGTILTLEKTQSLMATMPDVKDIYDEACMFKKASNRAFWVGAGAIVAGGVLTTIYVSDKISKEWEPFLIGSAIGFEIGGLIDIIFSMKYSRKMNKKMLEAVNLYNNSIPKRQPLSDVSLKFGITQSGGVGFTFDF